MAGRNAASQDVGRTQEAAWPATVSFRDVAARSALVGTFDPVELLNGLAVDSARPLMVQLGGVSDEVMVDGQARWTLKHDARREVLESLPDVETATRIIERSPAGAEDVFGSTLQAALSGGPVSLEAGPSQDARLRALYFASYAPFATARASAAHGVLKNAIEVDYARRWR